MPNALTLRLCNFGSSLISYAQGVKLQDALVARVKQGACGDTVLILQHKPVYTIGKRGTEADFKVPIQLLQDEGVDVVVAPRGGETTFHGPGQLVAYPVIDLRSRRLGARAYVEALEDAMIHALGVYGVCARGRVPGRTGVWVGDRKIGAVGVKISHGLSSHGLALNLNTDLHHFSRIVPCGILDKEITTLSRELQGAPIHLPTAGSCLEAALAEQLGYQRVVRIDAQQLLQQLELGPVR